MVAAKRSKGVHGAERLLTRVKSNIGPDGGGFGYALEQAEDGNAASLVRWGTSLEGSARDLLGEYEDDPEDTTESESRNDLEGWITDLLAGGKVAFDAFFTHILMHELMHALGPHSLSEIGRAHV